jgi:hypothetical protein
MKDGVYRYIDKDDVTNYGEYIIKVRETSKAFVFEKIKNDMRFSPAHLDMIFKSSGRVTVNKTRSSHAINTVGDDWFCIYPYRAGVPYVFELMEA